MNHRRFICVGFISMCLICIGAFVNVLNPLRSAQADRKSYYVAIGGADSNPGTLNQPFQTIQKCASSAATGDTCFIRAGIYHETVKPPHSGTSSAPITFQPYNGEAVTVDGADALSGWTPSSFNTHVYQANVTLNPNLFANQLFLDGQMVNEARWPTSGSDQLRPTRATAGMGTTNSLVSDPAITQGADFWKGATLHYWGHDWYISKTATITGSSVGSLSFTESYSGTCPYLCLTQGDRYYLSGVRNALQAPGEWYYDASAHIMYLWPATNDSPSAHTVEAKQRNTAFDLSGLSSIVIQGLHLFGNNIITDSTSSYDILDGITALYVSHFTTIVKPDSSLLKHDDGDFDYLAAHELDTGIILNGSNNTLRNSMIAYSAGNGVLVEGSNNTVTNNVIHDVDYMATYGAAVNLIGSGHQITHNTLYRAGRNEISSDWHVAGTTLLNMTIAYNDMFNANMLSRDSGELYVCCEQDLSSGSIDHNLVHDDQVDTQTLPSSAGFSTAGIYLDGGTNHGLLNHNVLWNGVSNGIRLNGGGQHLSQYNQVYNTTIAGGQTLAFGVCCATDMTGTQVKNNIVDVPIGEAFASGATLSNNVLQPTDPQFVDAAHNNYQIQSGSPARSAGVDISPYTNDGHTGNTPDAGAYPYGVTPWTAGASQATGIVPLPTILSDTPGVGQETLTWGRVANATGYKVLYGTSTLNYTTTLDVGDVTSTTISGLTGSQFYYFAVSAYNDGALSGPSTERWDIPRGGTRSATSTIYASTFDNQDGSVANKQLFIGGLNNNGWVKYNSVDFGANVTTFTANIGVCCGYAGQNIEVHTDSLTGPLLTTLTVADTGDFNTFTAQKATITSSVTGVHDLYLLFKGTVGIGNLATFSFTGSASGGSGGSTKGAFSTLQAESFDTKSGNLSLQCGGSCIGSLDGGSWAQYKSIDFGTGAANFTADIAVPAPQAGQAIALHLDSPTGTLIGTLVPQATADWNTFAQQRTAISGASGVHDLYLVIPGTGSGAGNIDWFTFTSGGSGGSGGSTKSAFSTLQAESFDAKSGNLSLQCGGSCIGSLDGGSWAQYKSIDFGTGASNVTINIAVPSGNAGQAIELHLDSPTGTLIGTLSPQATADWSTFTQQHTTVTGASGVHDVYLVIPGMRSGAGNIDWFTFS